MASSKKKYSEMTGDELALATAEFDREFAYTKTRPLTQRERTQHARARRRGRPRLGLGSEKIRVSVERGLLSRADAFARKHNMSRSELIAKGLNAIMADATG